VLPHQPAFESNKELEINLCVSLSFVIMVSIAVCVDETYEIRLGVRD